MNRRAVVSEMMYWFYYLPMTFAVVLILIFIPSRIVESSLHPVDLDAAQMEEMVFQRISMYEFPYGTVYNPDSIGLSGDHSALLSLSNKKFGYRVSIGDESYYGNKDFFDFAFPLRTYVSYGVVRPFDVGDVRVDLVYPRKYELFE